MVICDNPVDSLPEYYLRNLAAHLEAAGRSEDLHRLLALETGERRNAWYEARERKDQTAGYLDDIHRAWRLASAQAAHGSGWVGQVVRYALIVASCRSLAQSIPPPLVAMLVDKGIWLPDRALAHTRQAADPRQQERMLVDLAPYLPEASLEEALSIARESEAWEGALEGLAPYLPEPLLQQALEWLQVCEDGPWQGRVVAYLAPHLSRALVGQAMAIVCGFQDESAKALALKGLAPHLPESLLQTALMAVYELEDGFQLEHALGGLASRLSEPLFREALAMMRESNAETRKMHVLESLAPHLPDTFLQTALGLVLETKSSSARMYALKAMAPHLPEPLLQEALAAACEIEEEVWQALALESLAPHLPEALLLEALGELSECESPWSVQHKGSVAWSVRVKLLSRLAELGHAEDALESAKDTTIDQLRAEALSGLAPHLSESLIREALEMVRDFESESAKTWALYGLATYVPDQLLHEALEMVCDFEYEPRKAGALMRLAPRLPEPLLRAALAMAEESEIPWSSGAETSVAWSAWVQLLSRLAELGHAEDALGAVKDVASDWLRAEVLAGLAPHLSEPLLQDALGMAREFQDESARALALEGLAPHLAEPILPGALAMAQKIKGESQRAQALRSLAPHLPESLLREPLAMAQWTANHGSQAEKSAAWSIQAKQLSRLAELGCCEDALAMVRATVDEWQRAEGLTSLAPHLSEPLLRQALGVAQEIEDELARVLALKGLVPHLPEALLPQTLAVVRKIEGAGAWADALAPLGLRLAELGFPEEALEAVQRVEDESTKVLALEGLAPHLLEPLLQEVLAVAREFEDESAKAQALGGLAPHLPVLLLQEALEMAREFEDESTQALALEGLAPYLPEPLLREVLVMACEFEDKSVKVFALGGLAPYLPEPLLQEALAVIQGVAEQWAREERSVVRRVRVNLQARLEGLGGFQDAVVAASDTVCDRPRSETVTGLAPYLPDKLLRYAPATPFGFENEWAKALALEDLAPHPPDTLLREALAVVEKIWHGGARGEALAMLGRRLADLHFSEEAIGTALREVLVEAQRIEDEGERVRALTLLADHMAEPGCLEQAMAAAQEPQPDVPVELAPHLPESLLRDALAAAHRIEGEWPRARVLANLLLQLAELGYPEEALVAAEEIPERSVEADTLAKLARYVPMVRRLPILETALRVASSYKDDSDSAAALERLIPQMAELGFPEEALAEARALWWDEQGQASVLTELAPWLSEPLQQEALAVACGIDSAADRTRALAGLVPHVVKLPVAYLVPLWQEMLMHLASRNRTSVLQDLCELVPLIDVLDGPEAIAETFHAIQDVGRWWP